VILLFFLNLLFNVSILACCLSYCFLAVGLFFHNLNGTELYYVHTSENVYYRNFPLTFIMSFTLLFLGVKFYYVFSKCFRWLLVFVYFTYVPVLSLFL